MKRIVEETGRSLAIHPATARAVRLLLRAACRRLEVLESPSGYDATHHGLEVLASARQFIAEASRLIDGGS